jgi:hypothetical protein
MKSTFSDSDTSVEVYLDGCKTLISTLSIQVIQLIRALSEATVEPRRSVLLYTNLLAAPGSLRNWLILHVGPFDLRGSTVASERARINCITCIDKVLIKVLHPSK